LTSLNSPFFSICNNNNVINNDDITAAVKMNLLRTSTITNTAEATTTLTPNCCNVADGIFEGGRAPLENCYITCGAFIWSSCQYCWSKSYFKNGDTERCYPHGSGWNDSNGGGDSGALYAKPGECGSPCTSFASNTC